MDAYRTYLRGELGKLANRGDAEFFLARGRYVKLGGTPEELCRRFAAQALVDAEVARMTPQVLIAVTNACGVWRDNGVPGRIRGRTTTWVTAPIHAVHLGPAEQHLESLFAENGWRLVDVARDPRVLREPPYSQRKPGEVVAFSTLIAELLPTDEYRLIDGMHRAIQIARNGETSVHLCVVS